MYMYIHRCKYICILIIGSHPPRGGLLLVWFDLRSREEEAQRNARY